MGHASKCRPILESRHTLPCPALPSTHHPHTCPLNLQSVERVLFSGPGSFAATLQGYYSECSRGKAYLNNSNSRVVGPVPIPCNYTAASPSLSFTTDECAFSDSDAWHHYAQNYVQVCEGGRGGWGGGGERVCPLGGGGGDGVSGRGRMCGTAACIGVQEDRGLPEGYDAVGRGVERQANHLQSAAKTTPPLMGLPSPPDPSPHQTRIDISSYKHRVLLLPRLFSTRPFAPQTVMGIDISSYKHRVLLLPRLFTTWTGCMWLGQGTLGPDVVSSVGGVDGGTWSEAWAACSGTVPDCMGLRACARLRPPTPPPRPPLIPPSRSPRAGCT